MSTNDDNSKKAFGHILTNMRAFLAPAPLTTPIVHLNPAILASRASLDAFADQQLKNERALEQAARQAMLKEAFEGVPGYQPTAKEMQHMADMDAEKHSEKHSEGHTHRNTRTQRHE